ncbi:MAG: hypothetical protein WCG20_03885 [bacterium]
MADKLERLVGKTNEEILALAQPLIKDTQAAIERKDPLTVYQGDTGRDAAQILVELETLTPFGLKLIDNYLGALESLKNYKAKKKQKRKKKILMILAFGTILISVATFLALKVWGK